MRTFILLLGVLALTAVPAAADPCCGHDPTAACCVKELPQVIPDSAIEWSPAREYALVKFTDPVRIGDRVLMGEYIIEHDTDRMARGGPCTHIYSAKNRREVVVAFHCIHLLRPKSGDTATVTLRRDYSGSGVRYVLTEFQYQNSRAAHGVPGVDGVPLVR